MKRTTIAIAGIALLCGNVLSAAEDPLAGLNLEAHGFVSFGYLKSWGNNWHGDTIDGTDEFWEAAANAISRPYEHLRLGAQLFVRDLGVYGNGQVELDWAYADWRVSDELGFQVGRVKVPWGLYGESADVDAGRATVFLPTSIYPTRAREILLSTDGAKAYGSIGPVDWALHVGQRQLQTDGDFASYFAYTFQFSSITDISADFLAGGIINWRTPIDGLSTRLSVVWLKGLELEGVSAQAPVTVNLEIPDWYGGVGSLLYEHGDFTWAAEYRRYYADEYITTTIGNNPPSQEIQSNRSDAAYLSCTWHARSWLDCYAAFEGQWIDPTDRYASRYYQAGVAAIAVMPTANWSLKAEFRYYHGDSDVERPLNPDGLEDDWQVLALKTTVDF